MWYQVNEIGEELVNISKLYPDGVNFIGKIYTLYNVENSFLAHNKTVHMRLFHCIFVMLSLKISIDVLMNPIFFNFKFQ